MRTIASVSERWSNCGLSDGNQIKSFPSLRLYWWFLCTGTCHLFPICLLYWHWHKADSLIPPYFLSRSCKITKTKRIGHERVMLYPSTSNSFKLLQDPLNLRERPKSASPTVWFTFSPLLIPPSIPSSTPVGVGSHQIPKSSLSYSFPLRSIISSLFGFIWSLPFLFKPPLSPPLSIHAFNHFVPLIQTFSPRSLILRTLHPSIHIWNESYRNRKDLQKGSFFFPLNGLIKNCNRVMLASVIYLVIHSLTWCVCGIRSVCEVNQNLPWIKLLRAAELN